MLGMRWQPALWRELDRFQRELNQAFEGAERGRKFASTYPPVNVWEDAENLYAQAELPGIAPEQLEVVVTGGNVLSLAGERKGDEALKGTWQRRERGTGHFRREVTLPVAVDAAKVEAHFENGVLSLKLPKVPEARARRIEVRAADNALPEEGKGDKP